MSSDAYGASTGYQETDAGPALWGGFILFVIILLYVDLFVAQPANRHGSALRQAVMWSIIYVIMALIFCGWLMVWFNMNTAEEFLAGYLIEKSLSVDNLFVMILTFKMFHIRKKQQKELLVWGIIGAIIMRAAFILTGRSLGIRATILRYIYARKGKHSTRTLSHRLLDHSSLFLGDVLVWRSVCVCMRVCVGYWSRASVQLDTSVLILPPVVRLALDTFTPSMHR